MPLLEKVTDYLDSNPWVKARVIASDLGENRSQVNALLHSNSEIFQKNSNHQWAITSNEQLPHKNDVAENDEEPLEFSASLVVENIDLNDRLRESLLITPNQRAKDLAISLTVRRHLVTKTLHSFQDVFEKGIDNKWSVRSSNVESNIETCTSDEGVGVAEVAATYLSAENFEEHGKLSQQAVLEATLDRNILVLAPPGTGKTHTLIGRLVYAITSPQNNVDAGELLVLSFTRAAVGEVRERIVKAIADGAPSRLRYVQVKTFDAYATWLLNDGGYDIAHRTYDERIKLLSRELESLGLKQNTHRIDRARYLFIDEIQDLVGVRADMVFELIKRILARKGSVNLLGDPHQSLNEYQLKGNQTNSTEFLEKVQRQLRGGLEKFELADSHRYETPEMKTMAALAKKTLESDALSASEKFKMLLSLIPKISQEQLIECFEKREIDALLCRSNGEVYQWLNWHEEQGNRCTVNAGATGRPWPAWIAESVMHYQAKVVTRSNLLQRMNDTSHTTNNEEELNSFLTNERLLHTSTISLDEMAFRLKYFSPALKGDFANESLIVSTVHKAKGLEYKHVVVVEPSQKNISDEEVRVLYVAITRAKRSLTLLPRKQTPFRGWLKKSRGGHLRYIENDVKYLQVVGLADFDLDTLFISEQGGIDTVNLENYLLCYQEESNYCIRPESCNERDDHQYSLYLDSCLGLVRLCSVSHKMKTSLDAMSWGNKFNEDGAMLSLGEECGYQTIVHPMRSSLLGRLIGPAGIMPFPLIQGFYPLTRATEG